jgi:hypothetical protein
MPFADYKIKAGEMGRACSAHAANEEGKREHQLPSDKKLWLKMNWEVCARVDVCTPFRSWSEDGGILSVHLRKTDRQTFSGTHAIF